MVDTKECFIDGIREAADGSRTVRIYYEGPLDHSTDKKVLSEMKELGYEWYASGFDFMKNEREHCFDLPKTTLAGEAM